MQPKLIPPIDYYLELNLLFQPTIAVTPCRLAPNGGCTIVERISLLSMRNNRIESR